MVKVAVFVGCVAYVASKLTKVVDLFQQIDLQIEQLKQVLSQPLFHLAVALMLMNWALEALKWQLLTAFEKKTTFGEAFRGVLAGLGLSAIAPLGIGDYLGRLSVSHFTQKQQALVNIWFGHQCQLLATTLFAALAFWSIPETGAFSAEFQDQVLFGVALGLSLALFGVVIFFNTLIVKLLRFLSGSSFELFEVDFELRAAVLGLSLLRYAVFVAQFFLVAQCFGLELETPTLLANICLMFFLKSILPAFNFVSDLGVREFAAMYFFGKSNVDEVGIVAISLTVWCLNIFLPSLMGMVVVLSKKVRG